jgi:hypothetical protein
LDETTLLPKKTSEGSTGFYLGKLNKSDVLDVNKRKAALEDLLMRRTEVKNAMQRAIDQLPPDSPEIEILHHMDNEFSKRMDYLTKILRSSRVAAPAKPAIDYSTLRRESLGGASAKDPTQRKSLGWSHLKISRADIQGNGQIV